MKGQKSGVERRIKTVWSGGELDIRVGWGRRGGGWNACKLNIRSRGGCTMRSLK